MSKVLLFGKSSGGVLCSNKRVRRGCARFVRGNNEEVVRAFDAFELEINVNCYSVSPGGT